MFTLEVCPNPDHLLLRVGGELDLHCRPAFMQRLTEFQRHTRQPIVLDLSDLRFVDSSGLAALLGILRVPEENRPRLVLSRSDGPVCRVLHTTRLDLLLGIHPSIEAALAQPVAAGSAA